MDQKNSATKTTRRYPQKDVKLLFGLSAGRCAFPDCKISCIAEGTELDDASVLGKIAHIIAHSDNGPRADPNLSMKKRDCYDNWILLCPTHHDLIDSQANTYTVEDIKQWKQEHENWVRSNLSQAITSVTFVELESVTNFIINNAEPEKNVIDNFKPTAITDKLAKNNLTKDIDLYLKIGLSLTTQVQQYIENTSKLDFSFPERLKSGFIREYEALLHKGFTGDELFIAILDFASSNTIDFKRKAAALGVIAFLFVNCDLFEP